MNKDKLLHRSIYGLEEKFPEYSVRLWYNSKNRIYLFSLGIGLMMLQILTPSILNLLLFVLLNCLYFIAQTFKILLLSIGALSRKESYIIGKNTLPIYTILLPVYKEDKVLRKLVQSINKIDYPKDLLDVKLLIEEDDNKTINALKEIDLPEYFEVIKVPVSFPRTKPKACNYGLQFAKGKYITIYDAEDAPHPKQLKEVVERFKNVPDDVICVQAKLNFFNREENSLTKLFAIEYSILFDYMLVGLKKLKMPIPLGGTSNHFIREKLEELGGWDAFNVTEDADLGIRMHHAGYSSDIINSITLEEAPITLSAWIKQRSRWIKGHLLTSLLHLNKYNKLSLREKLSVLLFLYIPNLIYILLPIYLLTCALSNEKEECELFWKINLYLAIILPIGQSLFVILTKKWNNMSLSIFQSVLYFFLMPIAGMKACLQIFKAPFYWDKTEHGISSYEKKIYNE
ncbi:MAG: glycosyltransferase [Pseudomonadota bacterium]